MRSKLLKKNPRVQHLGLELIEFATRSCPDVLLPQVATPNIMNVLVRLLKIPELPPPVSIRMH